MLCAFPTFVQITPSLEISNSVETKPSTLPLLIPLYSSTLFKVARFPKSTDM